MGRRSIPRPIPRMGWILHPYGTQNYHKVDIFLMLEIRTVRFEPVVFHAYGIYRSRHGQFKRHHQATQPVQTSQPEEISEVGTGWLFNNMSTQDFIGHEGPFTSTEKKDV